ncbi:hypothetical protein FOL47_006199, partial [Perkinsus chesapeaki]
TVYQAEQTAIEKALEYIRKNEKWETLDIYLFTDSQSTLRAITGRTVEEQGERILTEANKLAAKGRNVYISWVPAHLEGDLIPGNAMADRAANQARYLPKLDMQNTEIPAAATRRMLRNHQKDREAHQTDGLKEYMKNMLKTARQREV